MMTPIASFGALMTFLRIIAQAARSPSSSLLFAGPPFQPMLVDALSSESVGASIVGVDSIRNRIDSRVLYSCPVHTVPTRERATRWSVERGWEGACGPRVEQPRTDIGEDLVLLVRVDNALVPFLCARKVVSERPEAASESESECGAAHP